MKQKMNHFSNFNTNNRPFIIRSNYGDESIALVQWVFEAGLKNVEVVTVDTGWAAEQWQQRLQLGETHAKNCGFKTTTVVSQITFADAVQGRGEFPSPKFQWCSALLKGLPFLDWLDTWDHQCQAIIMLAKRKEAASAHATLAEWIEKCEFHNERTVWHPMLNIETIERDALLARAGFTPLNHRSLECDPCVHSTRADLSRLSEVDIKKVQELEKLLETSMFEFDSKASFANMDNVFNNKDSTILATEDNSNVHDLNITDSAKICSVGILELIRWAKESDLQTLSKNYLDLFYRGCGNHFGCGL